MQGEKTVEKFNSLLTVTEADKFKCCETEKVTDQALTKKDHVAL